MSHLHVGALVSAVSRALVALLSLLCVKYLAAQWYWKAWTTAAAALLCFTLLGRLTIRNRILLLLCSGT